MANCRRVWSAAQRQCRRAGRSAARTVVGDGGTTAEYRGAHAGARSGRLGGGGCGPSASRGGSGDRHHSGGCDSCESVGKPPSRPRQFVEYDTRGATRRGTTHSDYPHVKNMCPGRSPGTTPWSQRVFHTLSTVPGDGHQHRPGSVHRPSTVPSTAPFGVRPQHVLRSASEVRRRASGVSAPSLSGPRFPVAAPGRVRVRVGDDAPRAARASVVAGRPPRRQRNVVGPLR